MKYLKIVFINLLLLGLGSCDYRYGGEPYYDYNSQYTPVIMDRADLEQSIRVIGPREIKDYGKIYIKDSLLFINEKFEGIHVVDNSDPSNPENLAFIVIPGNIDISILNDVIYADNAVDLIAIKYTGDSVRVIDRNRNIFPELPAPEGQYYSYEGSANRPENSVIVKWVLK